MKEIHYYEFQIGTAEFSRWGLDDRQARRLLARWLRIAWPKYRAEKAAKYPGSMADAIDNGWDRPPIAGIARTYCPPSLVAQNARLQCIDVIPSGKRVCIESFPVTAESIAEFSRVYDRRTK
jgi:hypothetical protein